MFKTFYQQEAVPFLAQPLVDKKVAFQQPFN
jgi:hypothetical protein